MSPNHCTLLPAHSYDEFIDSSGRLNLIKNYPRLTERSNAIGYEVTKVVFRGYHAGDKLQVCRDIAAPCVCVWKQG